MMLCQFRVNYNIKFSLGHVRPIGTSVTTESVLNRIAMEIAVAAWNQVLCGSKVS